MSRRIALLIGAAVALLLPFAVPQYSLTIIIEALIFGLFAMSLDLMFGYTRLVSFGHAAAYGFGAYASGWLLLHTGMPLLFAVFFTSALPTSGRASSTRAPTAGCPLWH